MPARPHRTAAHPEGPPAYGAQERSTPPLEPPVSSGPPRGQSARERDILHRSLNSED
ncbi:hypothetical protein [Streptomyces lasiicapitis]|uniref:hypothetical protein n=1 Tax=Streptomyces lasiicapitis TaxID=1923961 RepID=UPI00367F1535